MKQVLVDASVLMEIMLARPGLENCQQWLQDTESEYLITPLSVHILYYFAEVENISRDFVARLVALYGQLPMDQAATELAQRRYDGKDFEDCLQAACAEAGGCDQILTLDRRFARDSGTKLPVKVIR